MTLAPAARAPASRPDGIAAPPSRIARNADSPAPASSMRRNWAGTREVYSQPNAARSRRAGSRRSTTTGADPAQACPRRGPQRVRAELDPLGPAGGTGGGYHDRGAVRQVLPAARWVRAGGIGAPSYFTVLCFYSGWSESVQQIGDPGLRQARVP